VSTRAGTIVNTTLERDWGKRSIHKRVDNDNIEIEGPTRK
jgi:hypothetical protein